MDKELFKSLSGTILNDQSFGLLMADLKEIKGKLLQVFQTPDFIPKPLFKSELETLDPIQLANKDPIEITKLMYLKRSRLNPNPDKARPVINPLLLG